MKKHLFYLRYIIRHKWFVFIECCKRGIIWRGLVHDWSKFLPSEWFAYCNHFYGKTPPKEKIDKTGYSKPADTDDLAFDLSWLWHQHKNAHHWQHWISPQDDGGTKIFDIPIQYRKEMLSDWIGAGKALGFNKPDDCKNWYLKNKEKMILSPKTREWIENELKIEEKYKIINHLEQLLNDVNKQIKHLGFQYIKE